MLQYSRVKGFPECRTSCTTFSFVNAFGTPKNSAPITPSTKEQSASACSEPYKIMGVVQNPKSVSKAFLQSPQGGLPSFLDSTVLLAGSLRSCTLSAATSTLCKVSPSDVNPRRWREALQTIRTSSKAEGVVGGKKELPSLSSAEVP